MKPLHKTLFPLLTALLLLPLVACALSGSAIEGKVVEQGTDKPMAGAIVVARWHGTVTALVDAQTVCVHVESTTTDDQGRFHFPRWYQASNPLAFNVQPTVTAYKAGYQAEAYEEKIHHLKPFAGTREERLKKIAGAAVTCGSAGDSKKNLLPLYRKLYADALPLVVTKEDKKIINGLLYQIDLIELPYKEAEKKNVERSEALRHEQE